MKNLSELLTLRITSLTFLMAPTLISLIYMKFFGKSGWSSLLEIKATIAFVIIFCFPLAIGINLYRLQFPVLLILLVILFLVIGTILHMIPDRNMKNLMLMGGVLAIFYFTTFILTSPQIPWGVGKTYSLAIGMIVCVLGSGIYNSLSKISENRYEKISFLKNRRVQLFGRNFLERKNFNTAYTFTSATKNFVLETDQTQSELLNSVENDYISFSSEFLKVQFINYLDDQKASILAKIITRRQGLENTIIQEINPKSEIVGLFFEGEFRLKEKDTLIWGAWVIIENKTGALVEYEWTMPASSRIEKKADVNQLVEAILNQEIPIDDILPKH